MEAKAHGLLAMPGVGFFGMLIIGIIAGYIAEKVTSSDQGLLTNLIVGFAGSFVGGTLVAPLAANITAGSAPASSRPWAPSSRYGSGGGFARLPERRPA
jgi:uncharacterized membrane protein YeaQ/YmgE (transglycosylase-associated protein family)